MCDCCYCKKCRLIKRLHREEKLLSKIPKQFRSIKRFSWKHFKRIEIKQETYVKFFCLSWGICFMGLDWRDV